MESILAWNSQSCCLHLLTARSTDVYQHAWLDSPFYTFLAILGVLHQTIHLSLFPFSSST